MGVYALSIAPSRWIGINPGISPLHKRVDETCLKNICRFRYILPFLCSIDMYTYRGRILTICRQLIGWCVEQQQFLDRCHDPYLFFRGKISPIIDPFQRIDWSNMFKYLAEKWFESGPSRFCWPLGWRWAAGAFGTVTSGCCCCLTTTVLGHRQVNWLYCDAGGNMKRMLLSCCCCWSTSDAKESGGFLRLRVDSRRRRRWMLFKFDCNSFLFNELLSFIYL